MSDPGNRNDRLTALRIALIYVILGTLWIVFSDRVIKAIFEKPEDIIWLETFKGCLFIIFTGLMIYFLVRGSMARLRNSEVRYRTLFERHPQPLAVYDVETLRVLAINAAAVLKYGYTREEFMQVGLADMTTPEYAAKLRQIDFRALPDMHFSGEWPQKLKDGSVIIAEFISHSLSYMGRPARLLSMKDVTAQRQAEAALRTAIERYELVAQATNDPVWDWDLKTDRREWNEAFRVVFGFEKQEIRLVTGFWLDLIHPADRKRVEQSIHAVIDGGGKFWNADYRFMRRDATYAHVHDRGYVVHAPNGTPIRMVGCMNDITARIEYEHEIERLNNELEGRVRERTAELEEANRQLESFSYSVSHDLRAPLRAIEGFSNILREDYTARLDAEGRRVIEVITDNTRRMGQLIDDLLSFSRLGRLTVHQVEVDMRALAAEVVAELRPTLKPPRQVEFEIGELPVATGDPAMLKQVWVNLLGNAVKFTRPKELARIRVSGRVDGAEAVYSVEDNGVGFDMAYVKKLFGVFQRLHSDHEFEGTGVGLAIVHRVIHRHGGHIAATGHPGQGACLTFTLPVKPSPLP